MAVQYYPAERTPEYKAISCNRQQLEDQLSTCLKEVAGRLRQSDMLTESQYHDIISNTDAMSGTGIVIDIILTSIALEPLESFFEFMDALKKSGNKYFRRFVEGEIEVKRKQLYRELLRCEASTSSQTCDIYISYCRDSNTPNGTVETIFQYLTQSGLKVFVDSRSIQPGDFWPAEIVSAIHSCKAFVAVLTKSYVCSHYCNGELYEAEALGKRLFPVICERGWEEAPGGQPVLGVIAGVQYTFIDSGKAHEIQNNLTHLVKAVEGATFSSPDDTADSSGLLDRLDEFDERFQFLMVSMLKELTGGTNPVSISDFKHRLVILPRKIKHENDRFLTMKRIEIEEAKSFDSIFATFNCYLSFIDFSLLEHIIKHFGSPHLKEDMSSYAQDMSLFKKKTRAADVAPHLPRRSDHESLDGFSRLKAKFDSKFYETATLELVDCCRWKLACELSLSEVLLATIKQGSLLVTWLIPTEDVPSLMERVQKIDPELFLEYDILDIFIDDKGIYHSWQEKSSQEFKPIKIPILDTCKAGNVELAQELLEVGADPNQADEWGQTSLYFACFYGYQKCVELLINVGADVNVQKEDGATALYAASQNGHLAIIEKLLEVNANVNIKSYDGSTALYVAAQNGHLRAVEKLLEANADVNIETNNNQTALLHASSKGHDKVVKVLLAANATVNTQSKTGSTPLYMAAQNGRLKVLKMLLNASADVNIKDNDSQTALQQASENGYHGIISLLLAARAVVNAQDKWGQSPLWSASFNGHLKCVELLLDAGADVDLQKKDGATALYAATQNGDLDVVKMLIKAKAQVDLKGPDGFTALIMAVREGYPDIIKALLKANADLNFKNNDNQTALHLASSNGHNEIVKVLLAAKAEVNVQDKWGKTPLGLSSFHNHLKCMEQLLNAGASTDTQNENRLFTIGEGHIDAGPLSDNKIEREPAASDELFFYTQYKREPLTEKSLSMGSLPTPSRHHHSSRKLGHRRAGSTGSVQSLGSGSGSSKKSYAE